MESAESFITITDLALEKIHELRKKLNIPDHFCLRLVAVPLKDTIDKNLGFDPPREGDAHFDVRGIHLLINKNLLFFTIATIIDYGYNEIEGEGFFFGMMEPKS